MLFSAFLAGFLLLAGCGRSPADRSEADSWGVGGTDTAEEREDEEPERADIGPATDAGPASDQGVQEPECESLEMCSKYLIDLRVRSGDGFTRTFAGEVDVAGQTVQFQCPKPDGATGAYRCGYQSFGETDTGNPVESSVRVPVDLGAGVRDVSTVDAEVVGNIGRFEGSVELSQYSEMVTTDGGCTTTCSGGRGTVRLERVEKDDQFRAASAVTECTEDDVPELVFSAGAELNRDCSVDSDPRLVTRFVENRPDMESRVGTYRFGPEVSNGEGRICQGEGCTPASGFVSFSFYAGGEVAEGYWYAETESGESFGSSFTATSACVQPAFCR